MKSFYQKNEEYRAIIAHEKSQKDHENVTSDEDTETLSLDEAFKRQCSRLAKQELEREIANLRSVFSQVFLPKLLTLELSEVKIYEYFCLIFQG